jgi:hypothetical protein
MATDTTTQYGSLDANGQVVQPATGANALNVTQPISNPSGTTYSLPQDQVTDPNVTNANGQPITQPAPASSPPTSTQPTQTTQPTTLPQGAQSQGNSYTYQGKSYQNGTGPLASQTGAQQSQQTTPSTTTPSISGGPTPQQIAQNAALEAQYTANNGGFHIDANGNILPNNPTPTSTPTSTPTPTPTPIPTSTATPNTPTIIPPTTYDVNTQQGQAQWYNADPQSYETWAAQNNQTQLKITQVQQVAGELNITNLGNQADAALTQYRATLSANEQQQITALQNMWDSAVASQKVANESYVAANSMASFRAGGQYDMSGSLAAANRAIQVGLNDVTSLQSQEQAAISAVENAFLQEDYKAVTDNLALHASLNNDMQSALNDIYNEVYKAQQDAITNKQAADEFIYTTVTKPIQDTLATATSNGAPQAVKDAIQKAGTVQDAIAAAGDWLQSATGQLGDYLEYKRQLQAQGKPYEDYNSYVKDQADLAANEQIRIKSVEDQMTSLTTPVLTSMMSQLNDYNGQKYYTPTDYQGLSAADKTDFVTAAAALGYKPLSNKDADSLTSVTTAQGDLNNMLSYIQTAGTNGGALLPKDASGQPMQAANVTWNQLLQTNPNLAAFQSWGTTVISVLSAVKGASGSGGGGGAARLYQTVESNLPQPTDTLPTAINKINIIMKQVNASGDSIMGTTTSSSPSTSYNGVTFTPDSSSSQTNPTWGGYSVNLGQ